MYASGTVFAFSSKEHEDCVFSSITIIFDKKEEIERHKISYQRAKLMEFVKVGFYEGV